MNNIYDDTGNNNEPDYKDNLAFDPQSLKDVDEIKRLKTLLGECYLLINHYYMPTKNLKLLIAIGKELGYDKKPN